MMIRADVIEMANKEEEKLSFAAFAKEAEEARKRVLTYEEYFQLDPRKDGHIRPPKKSAGSSKGDTTYEQFVKDRASDNLFENDVSKPFYEYGREMTQRGLAMYETFFEEGAALDQYIVKMTL